MNKTNMERYGCYPSQTIEIQAKIQQNTNHIQCQVEKSEWFKDMKTMRLTF